MPKLTFWCDEETGEASPSDSPYFLIYVGDAQNQKSQVVRVRRESWDDTVDKGESRQTTVTFANGTHYDLVLIALLEEDYDNDFTTSVLEQVRDWMNNLDGLLQPTIAQTPAVIKNIRDAFVNAINNFSANDDLLGVVRFTFSAVKHFFGGGGHYRVKFEIS